MVEVRGVARDQTTRKLTSVHDRKQVKPQVWIDMQDVDCVCGTEDKRYEEGGEQNEPRDHEEYVGWFPKCLDIDELPICPRSQGLHHNDGEGGSRQCEESNDSNSPGKA